MALVLRKKSKWWVGLTVNCQNHHIGYVFNVNTDIYKNAAATMLKSNISFIVSFKRIFGIRFTSKPYNIQHNRWSQAIIDFTNWIFWQNTKLTAHLHLNGFFRTRNTLSQTNQQFQDVIERNIREIQPSVLGKFLYTNSQQHRDAHLITDILFYVNI